MYHLVILFTIIKSLLHTTVYVIFSGIKLYFINYFVNELLLKKNAN